MRSTAYVTRPEERFMTSLSFCAGLQAASFHPDTLSIGVERRDHQPVFSVRPSMGFSLVLGQEMLKDCLVALQPVLGVQDWIARRQ